MQNIEKAYENVLRSAIGSKHQSYWTYNKQFEFKHTSWTITHSLYLSMYKTVDDFRAWIKLYGTTGGAAVATFGKKSVWEGQVKVLSDPNPPLAWEYKKLIEAESGRIGISVSPSM